MIGDHKIFVVVPAHNEQLLIGRMLRRVPALVDQVLVVDDASDDETSAAARAVGDDRVRVIRHARNAGVGAAIATGYREALVQGADVTVVMAGDDQMHPDDLPALVGPVLDGTADYTKGDRLRHPEVRKAMPWTRRLGGKVLSACTGLAVGMPGLSDSQCGYTAIARRALASLDLDGLWPRYGYPNDLLGQLGQRGMRVQDVVVRAVYADEKSELRARHALRIGWLIARAAWRMRHPGE